MTDRPPSLSTEQAAEPPWEDAAEHAWDTALRALFVAAEAPLEQAAAQSVLAQLPAARFALDLRRRSAASGAALGAPLEPRAAEIDLRQGRIGRLQLLREIARGGVGVVLEAYDPDLGRRVAVKVLREDLAGNFSLVQRFVEEAQIGGQLQHPGIVPVYELGLDATHRPYFSMRLVEGRTLAAELQDVAMSRDRRRWLSALERVCQTVAYAHACGVVHRDLKPQNIMIGAYGEVLVMDWGLAKVLGVDADAPAVLANSVATLRSSSPNAAEAQLSHCGERLGTPAYMSPEQAAGATHLVDERADVWALGVMLFELLSGESWHRAEGAPAEVGSRVQALALDEQLSNLLERCLALQIEQRPRNAGEVAAALSAHLAAVEARARAAEVAAAAAETRSRAERKARRLGLSLIAALAATLLLVVFFVSDRRARHATLQSQVSNSIASSTDARRNGDYVTALAALDRATGAMNAAGSADEAWLRALQAERAIVQQEARTAQLRGQLLRLRTSLGPIQALEETFAHLFAELGVADMDARKESLQERAQTLLAGAPQLSAEIAATLLDWGHRRRRQGEPARRFQELFDLAMAIDDDPARQALRLAMRDRDLSALKQLTTDMQGASLATLHTAAEGFEMLGQPEEARALLEQAVERAPDDLWTRWQLVRLLMRGDATSRKAAEVHAAVASALHPDHLDPLVPAPERGPGERGAGPPWREGPPMRPQRRDH